MCQSLFISGPLGRYVLEARYIIGLGEDMQLLILRFGLKRFMIVFMIERDW